MSCESQCKMLAILAGSVLIAYLIANLCPADTPVMKSEILNWQNFVHQTKTDWRLKRERERDGGDKRSKF